MEIFKNNFNINNIKVTILVEAPSEDVQYLTDNYFIYNIWKHRTQFKEDLEEEYNKATKK